MATTAHDVAARLISEQRSAGRAIDKMQLQKLLYLVQGANLEFWGEPAFRESFRAYRNGPVIANVEQTYREASPGTNTLLRPVGGSPERLGGEVVDTIRTTLRHFGTWTARELEHYVKSRNSPWQSARRGLPPSASSSEEIPLAEIAAWFRQHGVDPSPEPAGVWDATADERDAADERLRRARATGVFDPSLDPTISEMALQALSRIGTEDHRGA